MAAWSSAASRRRAQHGLGWLGFRCSRREQRERERAGREGREGERERRGASLSTRGARHGERAVEGSEPASRAWSRRHRRKTTESIFQVTPWTFYFPFISSPFPILFSVFYLNTAVKQLFEVPNKFRKIMKLILLESLLNLQAQHTICFEFWKSFICIFD